MNPAIILILEYGLKYGPAAYMAARKILSKKEPTEADWKELDDILMKTGESYFAPKVP